MKRRPGWWMRWRAWAEWLEDQVIVLWYAYRDPRTPWYARVFSAILAAYAFSPIDLIPDFIPLVGYLDDLLILPVGVLLVRRMIPTEVLSDCRALAEDRRAEGRPRPRWMAILIVCVWLGAAVVFAAWILRGWLAP